MSETTPSFRDMQAQQAAVQSLLTSGKTDASRIWEGPDGGRGSVALEGDADAEGCRRVTTSTAAGSISDVWCPTPHGFWVHPDELFYRNATGRETYGGSLRSGEPDAKAATQADVRPDQIDCLKLLNEERRLHQSGREAAARARRQAYHRCLHQAR